MFVFVILVAVAAVLGIQGHPISHDDKAKLYRYHKECVEKTGVDEKLVDDYHMGQYSEEPAFKQYTYCLSKKLGLQNQLGEFQKEVIRNKLAKHIHDSAEIDKLIETCVVEKESPVESAFNSFKCYHNSSSRVGIFYVVTISGEKLQKIKKLRAQCLEETGADIKLADNARKNGEFSDDPLFKKYIYCMSRKVGFQSEDGKIQADIIKQNLTSAIKSSSKAEKLFEACVVEKDTPENTALNMVKCFCEKTHLNILNELALPSDKAEKLSAFHKECLTETTVDKSLIVAAGKGNFSEDPKFKEYLFCIGKKVGFQNADGDIQKEVIRQKINYIITDPVESQQLLEKCVLQKDTPQETAYGIVKCYYESSPNHINILKVEACIEEKRLELTKYNDECTAESGISSEIIEQVKKGIFTEDEKFKNHLFCFFKKLGLQNESGEIQKEILSKKFSKLLNDFELSEKLVEKCAIKRETPQDTAYGAFTCYYENTPTHFNIFNRF